VLRQGLQKMSISWRYLRLPKRLWNQALGGLPRDMNFVSFPFSYLLEEGRFLVLRVVDTFFSRGWS